MIKNIVVIISLLVSVSLFAIELFSMHLFKDSQ